MPTKEELDAQIKKYFDKDVAKAREVMDHFVNKDASDKEIQEYFDNVVVGERIKQNGK